MSASRRHTADSITDDALDALYAERDRLTALLDVVCLELEHWDGAASLALLRRELAVGLPEPRPPADSPRDDHTDPKEPR